MDKEITEFLSDVPLGTLPGGSTSTVALAVASAATSMTVPIINVNPSLHQLNPLKLPRARSPA